jgi:hypothetical protein
MYAPTSIAALALAASIVASSPASAGEPEFEAAAKCMAYVTVVSGADGKKKLDPGVEAVVSAFGNELILQGSGKSDEDIRMKVVNHLVEMNGFVMSETGSVAALKREVGPECQTLLASLLPAG